MIISFLRENSDALRAVFLLSGKYKGDFATRASVSVGIKVIKNPDLTEYEEELIQKLMLLDEGKADDEHKVRMNAKKCVKIAEEDGGLSSGFVRTMVDEVAFEMIYQNCSLTDAVENYFVRLQENVNGVDQHKQRIGF